MKNPKNTTLDGLAIMVKNGFDDLQGQINNGFSAVKTDTKELKEGQEEIKLRLDNVAYRFELVELQKRVDLLEKRVGIRR
jgi:hypothetical protein